MRIPLHELLLELRRDLVEQRVAPLRERIAFILWSYAWSSLAGYRLSTRLARLVPSGKSWRAGRAAPAFGRRYRDRR